MATAGLLICIVVVLAALIGAWFVPFDPAAQDIMQRLKPPLWHGPDGLHLLGTEELGRDIFSRVVVGAQVSLLVGVASVALSLVVGVSFGLMAGY